MKKTLLPLIAVLVFMMLHSISIAQPKDDPQNNKDEIKKILRQKFIEKLQVDEGTADRFFQMFDENKKKMDELNKQKRQTMKYIEDNIDASDISQKLDELVSVDDQINDQRRKFYSDVKTILSPKQIAQSLVLQNNFRKMLREEVKKRKDRGNDDNGEKPKRNGKRRNRDQ